MHKQLQENKKSFLPVCLRIVSGVMILLAEWEAGASSYLYINIYQLLVVLQRQEEGKQVSKFQVL